MTTRKIVTEIHRQALKQAKIARRAETQARRLITAANALTEDRHLSLNKNRVIEGLAQEIIDEITARGYPLSARDLCRATIEPLTPILNTLTELKKMNLVRQVGSGSSAKYVVVRQEAA